MATTATQSSLPTETTSSHSVRPTDVDDQYHTALLIIYTLVLLIGTTSLTLMMCIMKSGSRSTTSIAVFNLIFTHFVFLLTVPFRIYYYSTHSWGLSYGWCKVVSSMIHIHMYMSFIFYVIILIMRLTVFYRGTEQLASPPGIYAVALSVVVWTVVLVVVPCVIHFSYGRNGETSNATNAGKAHCFKFGSNIDSSAKDLNYIISGLIITVAVVLTALQASTLWVLYKKHQRGCTSQQDFGAQLKSLCFALIMLACFVPYHMFRFYYVEHIELENLNEVFLSLTTFNCLDMLTFMGKRSCSVCFPAKTF